MGRVFEKRKHKMFARYAKMSRAFTRIGKEIAIAVKMGGPDPDANPRLRVTLAKAKAINMPKHNLDNAIKRAVSKEDGDFEEVLYEGKGPHSIGIMIETATNNPTRTVANLRSYFNKKGGALGVKGSMEFLFEHIGEYKIEKTGINLDEFELEMIDHGAEEINVDDDAIYITTSFEDYGRMQKALEDKGCVILNAALTREPKMPVELTEEQEEEVHTLLELIEDDDDVTAVYTTMA
ncbi:transcriptional regulator [Bacteroidetes bacterium UKL13-3]|jgi:YebC/PmpR family DNA-binding regulatory protein|nr:transcriptional regulator [Bacteroidetes bacterium UKL13-3]HCP93003.1 YebC/PmpR family DNA-binding transcriptional regulator [Bacteroidota bacterium]